MPWNLPDHEWDYELDPMLDLFKWRTTITWISYSEQMHPKLEWERILVKRPMLNSGTLYHRPKLVSRETTMRFFTTQSAAEHYVSQVQKLAEKHGSTILSAEVDKHRE
jgi:hypothetical protein